MAIWQDYAAWGHDGSRSRAAIGGGGIASNGDGFNVIAIWQDYAA
jgi:hypothetical protein